MISSRGCGIAPRKLTISTSGIAPAIPRVRTRLGVSLALSLHAPNDDLRTKLMPINRFHSLDSVMKAVSEYSTAVGPGEMGTSPGSPTGNTGNTSKRRRVLIEYVMIQGVNDEEEHARQLGQLLREHDINAHVNLLPFNPFAGTNEDEAEAEAEDGKLNASKSESKNNHESSPLARGQADDPSSFAPSSRERLQAFVRVLQGEPWRVSCNVRWPRGVDIDAACGQLRQKYHDKLTGTPSGRRASSAGALHAGAAIGPGAVSNQSQRV